jgi:hypothetical protein
MASDSMSSLPAPEDESADAAAWTRELREFVHGRVGLVHTSAQAWLGVLTTILGLFSAVVVIRGGTAISELPLGTLGRGLVFLSALVVYGLTFWAVVEGALATFGGLGLEAPEHAGSGMMNKLSRFRDRWMEAWRPPSLAKAMKEYRGKWYGDNQIQLADFLRTRLHRSRLLGIVAALLAGLLALAVFWVSAFFHRAEPPTSVVVVHGGQVTCGSINVGADGQTRVAGQVISGATQVIVVAHC